jgi:hypothetical protein
MSLLRLLHIVALAFMAAFRKKIIKDLFDAE